MVTEHSNTVYNCGACGAPAYYNAGHQSWFHYGTKIARPDGPLCGEVTPVAVRLTTPVRATA